MSKKIQDHLNCEMILLERTYNTQNRWDLRCRTHGAHIKWLTDHTAQMIWDQVAHYQLHTKKTCWR